MCGALPPTLLNTDIQKLLCAGTLPAKNVPKNIEIQDGTLPIFCFESCSKSRNEHSA